MKNIHSPTEEEFVFTNKKRRMIEALMTEFIASRTYELYCSKGKEHPKPGELKNFINERVVFLNNIECFYGIEIIKGIWTGLIFNYQGQTIKAETFYRKKFFPETDQVKTNIQLHF